MISQRRLSRLLLIRTEPLNRTVVWDPLQHCTLAFYAQDDPYASLYLEHAG